MNTEEKLSKVITELSREELENKFISLYTKHEELKEDCNKFESEFNEPEEKIDCNNNIDFGNFKIKRRQQYLHKKYTKNASALNFILNELTEEKDPVLQKYFNELNARLEKIAQTNNDLSAYKDLYKTN